MATATKPSRSPSVSDPLADMLVAPGPPDETVDDPSMGSPEPLAPPGIDEYLTAGAPEEDDDDDQGDADEDEEEGIPLPPAPPPVAPQPPPVPVQARTSRRGFLGAAAAIVGGAAAAAVMPPAAAAQAVPIAAPGPSVGGMTPEMGQMAAFFTRLMDQRDAKMLDELDRRVGAIRAELPVPNGVVSRSEAPAELAHRPGQYPPSMIFQQPTVQRASGLDAADAVAARQPVAAARPPARMVAFIPKEDPYNPRQTMFRGWVNGRELRARRGQIMIVSLGTGVDWAKNGHGNCVDIAAMQGVGTVEPMAVPQAPDYSRPDTWDGYPTNNRSSIPIGAF